MNIQLLVDAIVRQTTVLIAQLATSGGMRAPLADVAEQIFLDLARELHEQGVSRKVAADMFGMALRTYRRRVQRLSESRTLGGRSLWEAVHDFLRDREAVSRAEIARRFRRDDAELLTGVLQDLVESGLVYVSGRGSTARYRAASPKELGAGDADPRGVDSLDALVWGAIFRKGPLHRDTLARELPLPAELLDACIERLIADGKVRRESAEQGGAARLRAPGFVIPVDEPAGWEAAVLDHFQAVVATLCQKLGTDSVLARQADVVGGSTYTLEVWPGHPLEDEALGTLARLRSEIGSLRAKIADHNRSTELPHERTRVTVYMGQSVLGEAEERHDEPRD